MYAVMKQRIDNKKWERVCTLGVNTGKQRGKKHLSLGVQRVIQTFTQIP